jgi:hypothetical protein
VALRHRALRDSSVRTPCTPPVFSIFPRLMLFLLLLLYIIFQCNTTSTSAFKVVTTLVEHASSAAMPGVRVFGRRKNGARASAPANCFRAAADTACPHVAARVQSADSAAGRTRSVPPVRTSIHVYITQIEQFTLIHL